MNPDTKISKKWLIVIFLALIAVSLGTFGFFVYRDLIKLPLPTPPTSVDKLAELHLVGGVAGFCDHLVVYEDGNASILDDCGGSGQKQQEDFQVKPEQFDQLVAMATRFGSVSYENDDNPSGPDSLYEKLILYGQASPKDQPNQEQLNALRSLMNSITNSIRVQGKLME